MFFAKKMLLPAVLLLKVLGTASLVQAAAAPNDLLNHLKQSVDAGDVVSLAFYGQEANRFYKDLTPDLPLLFDPPSTMIGHNNLFNCEKNALCQANFDRRQLIEPGRLSNGVLTYTYEAPLAESAARFKIQLRRISPWVVGLKLEAQILQDGILQTTHSLNREISCKWQQDDLKAPKSNCLIQARTITTGYPLASSVTPPVYQSSPQFFVTLQGDAATSLFQQMKSAHENHDDSILAEFDSFQIPQRISCFERDSLHRCHILYQPQSLLTSTLHLAGFQLDLTPEFKNSLLTGFTVQQDGYEIFQGDCTSYSQLPDHNVYECAYASANVQIDFFKPIMPPEGHAVIGGWRFQEAPASPLN